MSENDSITIPRFDSAADIRNYGRMILAFSNASKAIARGTEQLQFPEARVDEIAGKGRYNTRDAGDKGSFDEFVIYGQKKTWAAKSNRSGLFGAFPVMHMPYLQLSLGAPALLGKQGCKLQVISNGTTYQIPLDRLTFDFKPRERSSVKAGQVTLRNPAELVADSGETLTLDAGTPLTSHNNQRRGKEKLNFANDATHAFRIVDGENRPIDNSAAINMLWGHIGAMGFKKYGRGSQEFTTIAIDGTDDDVTAERYMIEWMESVRDHNGINLMHEFQGFVAEAGKKLQANDEFMHAMSVACAAAETMPGAKQMGSQFPRNMEYRDRDTARRATQWMDDTTPALQAFADTFGLVIPSPDAATMKQLQTEGDQASHTFDQTVGRMILNSIVSSKQNGVHDGISQNDDAFHVNWIKGDGVRFKDGQGLRVAEILANMSPEHAAAVRSLTAKRLADKGISNANHKISNLASQATTRALPFFATDEERVIVHEGTTALSALTMKIGNTKTSDTNDVNGQLAAVAKMVALLRARIDSEPTVKGASKRNSNSAKNKKVWKNSIIPSLERFIAIMHHVDNDLGKLYTMYGDVRCLEQLGSPAIKPDAVVTQSSIDGEPLPLGHIAQEAIRRDAASKNAGTILE